MKLAAASCIERLESRIAPAAMSVVITDVDGDKVTIRASHGTLDVTKTASGNLGGFLIQKVDLSGADANNADLSVTVAKAKTGDGSVNIPRIFFGNNQLGRVTVAGDLAEIDGGPNNGTLDAIKSLSVRNFTAAATTGNVLIVNGGDLVSTLTGRLGSLTVAKDFDAVQLVTTNGANIGATSIGGSFIGGTSADRGEISAGGNLGKVTIKGSVSGGSATHAGFIQAAGDITSVSVGGDVTGDIGIGTGEIYAAGNLGPVTIKGSLKGGSANYAGSIGAGGNVTSVAIGKDIQGGSGPNSGQVFSGYLTTTDSTMGPVKVGRDVIAGSRQSAGTIFAAGDAGPITVAGSLIGAFPSQGGETDLGSIVVIGTAGKISVGKNMASTAPVGGSIYAGKGAKSVSVGGEITGAGTAIFVGGPCDSVTLAHSITGPGIYLGGLLKLLTIRGDLGGTVSTNGYGIGKVFIGGQLVPGKGQIVI